MTELWVKPPCSHCGILKGPDDYHRCATSKDGLHSVCKPCRIKYNAPRAKIWIAKNREHVESYQKDYRAAKRRGKDDAEYQYLTRKDKLDTRSE